MKKFMIFTAALAMSLCFASCQQKSDAAKDGEQADVKTEVAEKADVPSLEDIVAKAKAEGANWSVDQWKDASKSVMINIAPMMKAIQEMTEKMEKNPDNVVSILAEMEKKQKEFEGLETLLNEYEKVAEATENGKKVMQDEAWAKEIKAELGLPDDF